LSPNSPKQCKHCKQARNDHLTQAQAKQLNETEINKTKPNEQLHINGRIHLTPAATPNKSVDNIEFEKTNRWRYTLTQFYLSTLDSHKPK